MRELPISFRGDMIEAILDGRKTQTRRVMKPQPALVGSLWRWKNTAWCTGSALVSDAAPIDFCPYGQPGDRLWTKRQRFQKKVDADAWLEVASVSVERVQDISEGDAMAEGISEADIQEVSKRNQKGPGAILAFRDLWDEINAKRGYSWEANPWVWVVEFKRVEP